MATKRHLGGFLAEVMEWDWRQFSTAERDPNYTTNEGVVFSLVRACAMQKLGAIRTAINRLDGKLVTPVQIIYPRVYMLYPHAEVTATHQPAPASIETTAVAEGSTDEGETALAGEIVPTLSLRQTVQKMGHYPRTVPQVIIETARAVDQHLTNPQNPMPQEKVPQVKSVVAAHLIQMAAGGDLAAMDEVFDQIDGKLLETIQVVGDDIYLTSYSQVAPPDARLNKDGVLQVEATAVQKSWKEALE